MDFLSLVGALGTLSNIAGVTTKDLIPSNPDKALFEKYFIFLEGRKVLIAPYDKEISGAVISSLESIKTETEILRRALSSIHAQHLILELIYTLSEALMKLHKNQQNDIIFYKALQLTRIRFSKVLVMLCSAYNMDLSLRQTYLSKMVLDYAYRPK